MNEKCHKVQPLMTKIKHFGPWCDYLEVLPAAVEIGCLNVY